MAEPYYITTAIHYPNGKPHIGHAYEMIAADAIARFQRQAGRDVRFMTGTDEHGLKMAQTARARDLTARQLADEMSAYFSDMAHDLNISYDRFIRTSDTDHYAASQAIWKAMEANGDLYLDRYEGWYSVRDEAFYEEKELTEGEGGVKLSPQGTPVDRIDHDYAARRHARLGREHRVEATHLSDRDRAGEILARLVGILRQPLHHAIIGMSARLDHPPGRVIFRHVEVAGKVPLPGSLSEHPHRHLPREARLSDTLGAGKQPGMVELRTRQGRAERGLCRGVAGK